MSKGEEKCCQTRVSDKVDMHESQKQKIARLWLEHLIENKGIKLSDDLANTKKATKKLGNMDKFKNTKKQLFSHNTQ